MTTLCDPLSHQMDIDDYDVGEHSGYCDICDAQLTYKWEYDQDQVDNRTYHLFDNMDMATMGDYANPLQSFAVLSRVDEDPELNYGVFIIPYTSVTITSLKTKPILVQTTTTHIINPTYEQLKSKDNQFGTHVEQGFSWMKRVSDDQFNNLWGNIVLNDSWLKTNFSAPWSAINKQYI